MHATIRLYGDQVKVQGLVATIVREALNSGVEIAISARPAKNKDVTPDAETPIEDRIRTVRAYNVLKRAKLDTLEAVARYGEAAIREIPGAGDKTVQEIKEALAATGLELAP